MNPSERTEKELWLEFARRWDEAYADERPTAECFCHKDAAGLCSLITCSRSAHAFNMDQKVADRIPMNRTFLFDCDVAGAKKRADFCRDRAAEL